MQGAETAIKTIPPLAIAAVSRIFDPVWLIVIPAGLLIGTMAQAGRMVKANKSWSAIRHELLVSALVGGANALLASVIIWQFDLNYLQGLVAATLCAFGGANTIDRAFEWLWSNLTRDAARMGRKRAEAHRLLLENTETDLKRLRGEED